VQDDDNAGIIQPNLSITETAANTFRVKDNNTATVYGPFSGINNLVVTLYSYYDNLTINLNGFTTAGSIAENCAGVGSGPANFFQIVNGRVNGNLYVLAQGVSNTSLIGDGVNPLTVGGQLNIQYQSEGWAGGDTNTSNTTTVEGATINSMNYKSLSPSATDNLTLGVTGAGKGFTEKGGASISFTSGNSYTLSMANGSVGAAIAGSQLNILGGGSGASVTLGDGTSAFTDGATTVIDLDNTSGGTITVNDNVLLSSTTRFDDYANIAIDPNGGPNGVNLGKGLTIWNSDAGSTVNLGDATNTFNGTITGTITFDTGHIAGDSDDGGSSAGAVDTLTLESLETLKGTLAANLNTSTDTIDVEGDLNGALTVSGANGQDTVMVGQTAGATISGTATVTLGSGDDTVTVGAAAGSPTTVNKASFTLGNGGDTVTLAQTAVITTTATVTLGSGNDQVTVNQGARIGTSASIGLGSTGAKTLDFAGNVGPTGGTTANVLTVTSGANAGVDVELQSGAVFGGNIDLVLTQSSNIVDYLAGNTAINGGAGKLIAFGHTPADSFLFLNGFDSINRTTTNFTVVP